jgi:CRISPR system Cascade subunit CasE
MSAPNLIHGALESCFPGERQHPLWRIDRLNGSEYLLLLSRQQTDLTTVAAQFGDEQEGWESREYSPLLQRIQPGTMWHFRLVANPTWSEPWGTGGKRGKVNAHTVPKFQKKWLMDRASKHGFELAEDTFDVMHSQWYHFRKTKGSRESVDLLSVTYEGVLRVTDPEQFQTLLCHGIGRGKAYGMGLFTVVSYYG